MRVSLTGPSIEEVKAGFSILRALELRMSGVTLISCPTCGRKRVDVAAIVEALRRELDSFPEGLTLAVMGCEVNGPREASHADLGIAAHRKESFSFAAERRSRSVLLWIFPVLWRNSSKLLKSERRRCSENFQEERFAKHFPGADGN